MVSDAAESWVIAHACACWPSGQHGLVSLIHSRDRRILQANRCCRLMLKVAWAGGQLSRIVPHCLERRVQAISAENDCRPQGERWVRLPPHHVFPPQFPPRAALLAAQLSTADCGESQTWSRLGIRWSRCVSAIRCVGSGLVSFLARGARRRAVDSCQVVKYITSCESTVRFVSVAPFICGGQKGNARVNSQC